MSHTLKVTSSAGRRGFKEFFTRHIRINPGEVRYVSKSQLAKYTVTVSPGGMIVIDRDELYVHNLQCFGGVGLISD